ncbi:hypothetical protein [Mycolicibacterium wolinskyi]|uniref:hypothetical protein n=1 Tax=Mycolicibacterium wolinskyi TaxID=59750 RepID=UPI003917A0B0
MTRPNTIEEVLTKVYIDGMAAKEKELEAMADGARAYIHRPLQAAVSQPLATIEQLVLERVQENQTGQFEDDAGNICWYLDDLTIALKQLIGGRK